MPSIEPNTKSSNLGKIIETYTQRVEERADDLLTIFRLGLASVATHVFP